MIDMQYNTEQENGKNNKSSSRSANFSNDFSVTSSTSLTNVHGSYLNNPTAGLAMLSSWAPENFTDPKQYAEMVRSGNLDPSFKFIIHTTSLYDLVNQTGIFSLKKQSEIQQWDAISASVISNKRPFSYKSVGVILKVPQQNILATDNEDMTLLTK